MTEKTVTTFEVLQLAALEENSQVGFVIDE